MKTSVSTIKLFAALVSAQAKFPAIAFNKTNPYYSSKYADLGAVIEATRPILSEFELAIIQTPCGDGTSVGVETTLVHSSGEWASDVIYLPIDHNWKNPAQEIGKIVSYLRRYSWSSMIGVYSEEDNDGNNSDQQSKRAAPKAAPKAAPQKPAVEEEIVMSLEEAKEVTTSKGDKYGNLSREDLETMKSSITKSLSLGQTAELRTTMRRKLKAIELILAES